MEPMTMMALGSAGGSLLSGLGGMFGGSSSAKDLKKAARAMLTAQREAQAYNEEMYGKAAEGIDPYRQGGLGALPYYLNMASGGLLGEEFNMQDSPAYTYQRDKIQDTINSRMAAMGMANSSSNVNALADAEAGLAAREYENAFGRMSGLANMGLGTEQYLGNLGMGAASQNAQIAQTGASQYGNLMGAMGQAQGAGIQSLFNGFGGGIDNAMSIPMMNQIFKTGAYV